MKKPKYTRILLKLSGESLMGKGPFGISQEMVDRIIDEVCAVHAMGVQLAIVVGGGNIFRGSSLVSLGIERADADYIGMLATLMNAIILQKMLQNRGVSARSLSALQIETIVESYMRIKAIQYLEQGSVVIFAAGTGNPFFTTDTAAALRATEMGVQVILKATKVDGVYTSDPNLDPDAQRYSELTFDQALKDNLGVMDATALALCRDQKMPVIIFNIFHPGALLRVIQGEDEGTVVSF